MLDLSTLLVPADFSEPSAAAAAHAVQIAKRCDSRLLFAHVIEPEPAAYRAAVAAAQVAPTSVLALQGRLREAAKRICGDLAFETVVMNGDPATRLVSLARERQVDMVIMATRGRGPVRRLLLGSLAAKLLHDLTMPMLTGIHLEDKAPFNSTPYRKVVCALGLRDLEHSRKVLDWAQDFAARWDADLVVAHTPPAVDWGAGEWFPADTRHLLERAAGERLAQLLEEADCEAETHIGGLDAVRHVGEVIERTGGDILVVGRSADHSWLGGADAYAMIRESPVPVISV